MSDSPLRDLPSVSSMLLRPAIRSQIERRGRETVVSAIRSALAATRSALTVGDRR